MQKLNKYSLFLLLLISNICIAQKQLADYVVGKGNLTQVGATSTTLDIRISFTDESGVFDGTNITTSCALVFFNTNDNKAYELPITAIVTASLIAPVVRVNITGFSGLNSSVTGQGIVYKKNSANSIIPYVSGITTSLQQAIQRATVLDIENRISNISTGGGSAVSIVDTTIITTSNLSFSKSSTTINNGATAITLTIPTGLPAGYSYKLKISDSSTGVITIASSENVFKSTLTSTTITSGGGGVYDLIKNGLGFWNLQ